MRLEATQAGRLSREVQVFQDFVYSLLLGVRRPINRVPQLVGRGPQIAQLFLARFWYALGPGWGQRGRGWVGSVYACALIPYSCLFPYY